VSEIEVVHLVWKPAGLESFRRFLDSYREFPAEVDHHLLVLFKAFRGDDLEEYRAHLAGIPHRELLVPNTFLDLGAYFYAAARAEGRFLCFLNSHATVLAAGWLRRLYENVTQPGVAAAGSTGS